MNKFIRELAASFKSGFWTAIGLVVGIIAVIAIWNALKNAFGGVIKSDLLLLAATFLFIAFVGALRRYAVYCVIRYRSRSHSTERLKTKIIAGEVVNAEVLFYAGDGTAFRGYVGNDPIRRGGHLWLPVHFSSPPTAKTGGVIIEVRACDPRLMFTGKTIIPHIPYQLTWGGLVGDDEEFSANICSCRGGASAVGAD